MPKLYQRTNNPYYEQNRERLLEAARNYQRQRRYHLSPADFEVLFSKQKNQCAACDRTNPGTKGWIIDHDHKTGKVRGIVCHKCNVVIGTIERNAYDLKKLFAYVTTHRGQDET